MSRLAALLAEAQRRTAAPAVYIPHTPHPQQAKFLALDCLEALYGGAVGGGKSDALLMASLQYVHVPGYAALVLRRTYQDLALPGAIMDRSHEWLSPTPAKWNGTDKRWTFPSGATLSFGYLDTERDKFRYASAEFQFIGFDELTQFPEAWFRFLFSRLRKAEGMPVPLRMRAATNPGGLGHEWVKRRFIDGDVPFVPAKLSDNPSVDATTYLESLAQMDATTRRQLLDGVWVRDSGGLVYQFDDLRNVVDRAPTCTRHIIGIDYGFTDATAFCVIGWRDNEPAAYVLDAYKRTGMTPTEAAEEAKKLAAAYSPERIVADIGGLGKGYAEEARRRFRLPIEPAEKKNKRGYIDLLNDDLAAGRLTVVRSTCADLTKEWLELPWTEDRSKEAAGFDNHCADAVLYAWRAAFAYLEEPRKPKPSAAEREEEMEREVVAQHERELAAEWWDKPPKDDDASDWWSR